jgi:hypothetical protein
MAKASGSDATGTARAATLREQIDQLKGCGAGRSGDPARFHKGYPSKGGHSCST